MADIWGPGYVINFVPTGDKTSAAIYKHIQEILKIYSHLNLIKTSTAGGATIQIQGVVETEADLPLTASVGDVWIAGDTGSMYVWSGLEWAKLDMLSSPSATTEILGVVRLGTQEGVSSDSPSDTRVVTESILKVFAVTAAENAGRTYKRAVFKTPGNHSLAVGAGIGERAGEVYVTLVGGGGGGATGSGSVQTKTAFNAWLRSGGPGGAGACILSERVSVSPGDVLDFTVGAGGAGAQAPATFSNAFLTAINGNSGEKTSLSLNGAPLLGVGGGAGGTGASTGAGGTVETEAAVAIPGAPGFAVNTMYMDANIGNYYTATETPGPLTPFGTIGAGGSGGWVNYYYGNTPAIPRCSSGGKGGDGLVVVEWYE